MGKCFDTFLKKGSRHIQIKMADGGKHSKKGRKI